MNTFNDKFHRLIEVLNTLGHVEEEIGPIDILDILGFFLVKTALINTSRRSSASWFIETSWFFIISTTCAGSG
jgi:hypothetical protein